MAAYVDIAILHVVMELALYSITAVMEMQIARMVQMSYTALLHARRKIRPCVSSNAILQNASVHLIIYVQLKGGVFQYHSFMTLELHRKSSISLALKQLAVLPMVKNCPFATILDMKLMVYWHGTRNLYQQRWHAYS